MGLRKSKTPRETIGDALETFSKAEQKLVEGIEGLQQEEARLHEAAQYARMEAKELEAQATQTNQERIKAQRVVLNIKKLLGEE